MALTFPRDMTSAYCWETAAFRLMQRQEISRSKVATQVRDLAPALWVAQFETYPLKQIEADRLHADMQTLAGALRSFYAHTAERKAPIQHDGGDLAGVTIHSVAGNRTAIRLAGLPAGMQITAGDYIGVTTAAGRDLLRAAEDGVAGAEGVTGLIAVTPHVRPAVVAGNSVSLTPPMLEMQLDPDSLDKPRHSLRRWRVSFSATQVLR